MKTKNLHFIAINWLLGKQKELEEDKIIESFVKTEQNLKENSIPAAETKPDVKETIVQPAKKTEHYILIDFENIQPKPESLSFLEDQRYRVLIFVGAKQTVSIDRISMIQALGNRAQYIQIKNSTKNALDFHIAYYLGMLACKTPEDVFYVVSKDTGYDALLTYMRSCKLKVRRVDDIDKIGKPNTSNNKTVNNAPVLPVIDKKIQDGLQKSVTSLKAMGTSRPRLVKTLTSTLKSIFRDDLSDRQIGELIQLMQKKKYISVSDQNKITYTFKN